MDDQKIKSEEQLLKLINDTDNALNLGKQGLLREIELHNLDIDFKLALKKALIKDSILHRQYEKFESQTYWMHESHDGYASPKDVEGKLLPLRDFAVKFLEDTGKTLNKQQHYVEKGQTYTGRKLLREILSSAEQSIDIQDNYIHGNQPPDVELLNILEPYITKTPSIKMRVLTNQVSNAFKSDFQTFNSQYPNHIEIKKHNNCHGRFVVIDGSSIYAVGYSLKDLGKKADLLSEVTEETEKNKIIQDYEDWWKTGVNL